MKCQCDCGCHGPEGCPHEAIGTELKDGGGEEALCECCYDCEGGDAECWTTLLDEEDPGSGAVG